MVTRWLNDNDEVCEGYRGNRDEYRQHIFIHLKAYGEDVPDNAVKLVAWLTERLDKCPQEYRHEVVFEMDAEYESSQVEITFGYWRFETREEVAVRMDLDRAQHERRMRENEAVERRKYEELKRRFEPRGKP